MAYKSDMITISDYIEIRHCVSNALNVDVDSFSIVGEVNKRIVSVDKSYGLHYVIRCSIKLNGVVTPVVIDYSNGDVEPLTSRNAITIVNRPNRPNGTITNSQENVYYI